LSVSAALNIYVSFSTDCRHNPLQWMFLNLMHETTFIGYDFLAANLVQEQTGNY
jgi:hypothetical protein